MNAAIIRNPASWILNRPSTSMNATVNQYPGTVPHSAISVWARAMWNSSSSALIVRAAGIHPTALKMSFWNRFCE